MDVTNFVERDLDTGTIRELYLYKLPVLKTVENWNEVQEVGRIAFKGKHANYNGGLVYFSGRYFFVPDARLNAIASLRKWKFNKTIKVVTEEAIKQQRAGNDPGKKKR